MQLGLSESARVTTAEESRFRIYYPNSRPRSSRIIALDEASYAHLKDLREQEWNDLHILRYIETIPPSDPEHILTVDGVLEDVEGNQVRLSNEIEGADVIVMVTSAGTVSDAAETIGLASFVRHRMATGMIRNSDDASEEELARTLKTLRPFAAMLVVSSGDEYIPAILSALRA